MRTKLLASAFTAALALGMASGAAQARNGGCSGNSGQEAAGTVAGAVIGGIIGNQVFRGERTAGTIGGALIGGLAGNQLAQTGDDCDQYYASDAYRGAFDGRSGDRVSWRNQRSGNYGYVEPGDEYNDRGRDCRTYTQEYYVRGEREYSDGVACRNRNGDWEIVR